MNTKKNGIPPIHGQWSNQVGFGFRKKKTIKKEKRDNNFNIRHTTKSIMEQNSKIRSDNIKFVNKPLSNFDLIDWVKKIGVKHFRGIYSRDNLPKQILKEVGIINLDTVIGPGTHWVCFRNIDKHTEYFDSFGLKMPKEVANYLNTSNKQNKTKHTREIVFYVDIGVCITYNNRFIIYYFKNM